MTTTHKLAGVTLGLVGLVACSGLNSPDVEPDTDADTQSFTPGPIDVDTTGDADTDTDPGADSDTTVDPDTEDPDTEDPDTNDGFLCDRTGFTTVDSQSGGNATAFIYQAFNTEFTPFDTLVLQIFDDGTGIPITGPGTYTIAEAVGDRNLQTCSTCVRVLQTCDENVVCDTEYFATSGTITVTQFNTQSGTITGVINDLELEEVTVDPNTILSTPVPGGDRWCIDEHIMGPRPTGDGFEPVSVGFGFDGAWDGSAPRDWVFPGQGGPVTFEPLVEVVFVSAAFFSATTLEQAEAESCRAYAGFDVVQGTSTLDADGETVWSDLDATISILPVTWDFDQTSCAFAVDSGLWGLDGQDLLDAFTNIRFGMGVGPMTPQLLGQWQDPAGNWANPDVAAAAPSMVGTFTALNDENGVFVLEDYSTSFAFEIDTTTWTRETDASGNFLIYQDVTGLTSLPPTYLRGNPYFYRNFSALDLSNLGDGRPQ